MLGRKIEMKSAVTRNERERVSESETVRVLDE